MRAQPGQDTTPRLAVQIVVDQCSYHSPAAVNGGQDDDCGLRLYQHLILSTTTCESVHTFVDLDLVDGGRVEEDALQLRVGHFMCT